MKAIEKLITTIIVIIASVFIVINALVPQLSGWATAVSDVDGVDYGWGVYLLFLVAFLSVVVVATKGLGIGKK